MQVSATGQALEERWRSGTGVGFLAAPDAARWRLPAAMAAGRNGGSEHRGTADIAQTGVTEYLARSLSVDGHGGSRHSKQFRIEAR